MTRRRRAWAKLADRGSASAEIAIAAPVLVVFLLLVVACGRLVSASLDVSAAAHAAARAASMARTVPTADTAAREAATATLAGRCQDTAITLDTAGLRPGAVVTATITCTVPLSDVLAAGFGAARDITATATSPVDTWRSTP